MSDERMSGWEYLMHLNKVCHFTSRETKGQKVSNSELKRWCQNSVLRINGEVIKWDQLIPEVIESVTLFSKANKVTIW